jgi:Domain of unknown function (DUF4349)
MRLSDEQIGAELQALRELPSGEFAAQLDAWAAEGFPSLKQLDEPRQARPRRSLIGRRPVLAALAAGAVIVTVVGASVAVYLHENNGGSRPLSASGGGGSGELLSGKDRTASLQGSVPKAAAGGSAALSTVAPAPPGSRPRDARPQVQELSASLGLSTDADQIQSAADGVVDVTNRYDGFVDSSDVQVGGRQSHASFSLRIPATHLRDALDDLSSLGRVTLRTEASANVTGAYVDAGKAYHEARSKVDSLLAELRSASTPAETAAIRQQLVSARQELVAAREALRGLKGRVAYAPVTVQIRADGDGSWSIGDAADDAAGVLKAIVGATLITLAVLVPLAALLVLGWLGAREFGRRRREATLDRS